MPLRVAVVGGGVSGLVAARELVARGLDVDVFEAADRPGGVLRSERDGGFLCEHAANGFLSGDPQGAVPLCRELGVELAGASREATKRWVFVDGALREVPSSPGALFRTDLLSWRGKLALAREPLARRGFGDESVAAFARRRLGAEAERALVSPLVTGVFAGDADALSVRAAFPAVAERDARGGLVRSFAGDGLRSLRRRATGKPPEPRERSRLTAPLAGAEALPRAVAAELGERVQLSAPVESVDARPGRVALRIGGEERGPYAAAVLAVPAPRAAELVGGAAPGLAATLREIPHAPVAAVHLGYRTDEIEHPLDGFGFLVAAGESPGILGAVFESTIFPGRAPDGRALVRAMIGGARDPELVACSDDELVRRARGGLERALGVRAAPERARVTRWRRGIPQYTIGHAERVRRADRDAARIGVALAGSAYRGVAVNKLVADGARVAAELLQRLGSIAAVVALFVALAGCSGGQRAPATGDEGDESSPPSYEARAPDEVAADAGTVAIEVQWLPPPPERIRAEGANGCGVPRRRPLLVHTMGGVRGAVVALAEIDAGRPLGDPDPALVAIEDCRPSPRVALAPRFGSPIDVTTRDERRHGVTLTYVGGLGGFRSPGDTVRALSMPLVGQRYRVEVDRPGVYTVRTEASPDERSYVVMPAHPYTAVTDGRGRADLDLVPAGRYELKIWHPPLEPGGAAIRREVPVTVVAGEEASVSVSLASERDEDERDGGARGERSDGGG